VRVARAEALGVPLGRLAASTGLVSSACAPFRRSPQSSCWYVLAAEARRLLASGGLYLNNARVKDHTAVLREKDLLGGRVAVLRAGKDEHRVLALGEGV
jgi:hypothetical protein